MLCDVLFAGCCHLPPTIQNCIWWFSTLQNISKSRRLHQTLPPLTEPTKQTHFILQMPRLAVSYRLTYTSTLITSIPSENGLLT